MSDVVATSYPLWPDNPSAADLLGFGDIATPIVEVVGRDRLDPVVVGLYGAWGSGKSTILELAANKLGQDRRVVVVRATPWEYDATTDVKAMLIGQVLSAVTVRVNADQDLKARLASRLGALVKRVRWSKAITLAAKSALTVQLPSIEKITEVFGKEEADEIEEPSLAGFRSEFAALMLELGDAVTRVVVLVDDLDRCLNPAIVATLEGIKLFLAVPKMAFVIAADEKPVIEALSERYAASEFPRTMARQYLEKIVQIPLRVPALGLADTEAYLALMLLEHRLGAEELHEIVSRCDAIRRTGGTILIELPDNANPGATNDAMLARTLAPILARHLEGNPRRLKRFLNAFWLRSSIASTRSISLDPSALAKLMVLEELFEDRFALVVRWSAEGRSNEQLTALEDAARGDGSPPEDADLELLDWARLPPRLSDVELGPYLRLAATLKQLAVPDADLRPELADILDGLASKSESNRKAAVSRAGSLEVADRVILANRLARIALSQPQRQTDAAESLASISRSDQAVALETRTQLWSLDPQQLKPGTAVWLTEQPVLPPIVDLLKHWIESLGDSPIADTISKRLPT